MSLRVLNYNIWEGGGNRLSSITRIIEQQQPDVVALLEARNRAHVEELASHLNMHMAIGEANNYKKDNIVWLSRFPITATLNHRLPILAKTLLEITIDWEGTPLRLFATHLKSGQTHRDEQRRVAEMQAILEVLHDTGNQPHLLSGDLNTIAPDDQPDLHNYAITLKQRNQYHTPQFPRQVIALLLEAGYQDCYRNLHPGEQGYTSHTDALALRVDYILASPALAQRLQSCNVIRGGLAQQASDHYPLLAEFR
jgi:endonuclease/exonuclease/phosphatase family metal-dependent hydrolase